MELAPYIHFKKTAALARKLSREEIYEWFVTKGYFPEAYVLPPCFKVTRHPAFGKIFTPHTKGSFRPKLTEYLSVQFPKTDYTDRTFGIIDPELNSDIAYILSRNWKSILKSLFHESNQVCSYSFPIPLNSNEPGHIGNLRSGRLIYEFIEMAENDIAAISYGYRYLIKTDVKSFYPSLYTHSIAWAIHGKNLFVGQRIAITTITLVID